MTHETAIGKIRNRWRLGACHLGSYMHRWVLGCPWFNIRLHHILKSDEGREFHDHPFHFISIILRGGYTEHRPGCLEVEVPKHMAQVGFSEFYWRGGCDCKEYRAPAIVVRRATDFHRLELPKPAWTLVFASKYWREWGFLMPDGSWMHYEKYHRTFYKMEE